MKWLATTMLLVAMGCQAGQLRPAPIDKDDVCAFCKMAISTARYAAQVIDGDGNYYKFDDIGCMLRFVRERRMDAAAVRMFVMNYAGGKSWIDARKAFFVRSSSVHTPMASGIVAFGDRTAAADFSAKNKGEMLAFDDLAGNKMDHAGK